MNPFHKLWISVSPLKSFKQKDEFLPIKSRNSLHWNTTLRNTPTFYLNNRNLSFILVRETHFPQPSHWPGLLIPMFAQSFSPWWHYILLQISCETLRVFLISLQNVKRRPQVRCFKVACTVCCICLEDESMVWRTWGANEVQPWHLGVQGSSLTLASLQSMPCTGQMSPDVIIKTGILVMECWPGQPGPEA